MHAVHPDVILYQLMCKCPVAQALQGCTREPQAIARPRCRLRYTQSFVPFYQLSLVDPTSNSASERGFLVIGLMARNYAPREGGGGGMLKLSNAAHHW